MREPLCLGSRVRPRSCQSRIALTESDSYLRKLYNLVVTITRPKSLIGRNNVIAGCPDGPPQINRNTDYKFKVSGLSKIKIRHFI